MIRFGVLPPQECGNFDNFLEAVLDCERLNFDSIWMYDHLYPFWKRADEPILECWTTLSALACETTRLRLGTLVLCNTFRYPSVLAKMASTLDVISGGRLEFGIGAGFSQLEHASYGIPFESPAIRVGRLRESVQIIKKMWTEPKASFEGKYYSISEAFNEPQPVQKPHPPIWIGGGGEKLTLRIVAELADGCNFWGLTPDECLRKLNVLRIHCSSLGRRMDDISKSWGGEALVVQDKDELKKSVERFGLRGMQAEDYVRRHIVGTPQQCINKINELKDTGVGYFMLFFPDILDGQSIEVFAKEVVPSCRE